MQRKGMQGPLVFTVAIANVAAVATAPVAAFANDVSLPMYDAFYAAHETVRGFLMWDAELWGF